MQNELSEAQLKVRQEALSILMKEFDDNKVIYACADEWCKKYVTTAGLVSYCKAYYNSIKSEIDNGLQNSRS